MDLRRLELAPALTREVAVALSNGQFVNFGTTGSDGNSAAASGSNDVMRVVQTLLAAQVITRNDGAGSGGAPRRAAELAAQAGPAAQPTRPVTPPPPPSTPYLKR